MVKEKLSNLDYPGNLHFCKSKLWEKDQITRSAKTFVFCSFSHIKKKQNKMFFSEKNSPEILYYILFDFTLFHNFSLEKFAFYFQRVFPSFSSQEHGREKYFFLNSGSPKTKNIL